MKKNTQPIAISILGLLMAGIIGTSFAQSMTHAKDTIEPTPYHKSYYESYHKYHGVSNEQIKVLHGVVQKHLNTNDFVIKDIDRKSNRYRQRIYEVEVLVLPENRQTGITVEHELLIDYANKTVISDKIDY